MKRIFSLTKVMTKTIYDEQFNAFRGKKHAGIKSAALYLFLGIYLAIFIVGISATVLEGLIHMNQPSLFLYLLFFIASVFIAATAVFTLPNILYYSKDNPNYFIFPLKPWEIILSKLFTAYISILTTLVSMVLPALIVYYVKVPTHLFAQLMGLVGLFLLPIIPLAFVTLIIVTVFTFTPLFKRKEVFTYASTLITFILVILVSQLSIVSRIGTDFNAFIEAVSKGDNTLYQWLGSLFPSVSYFTKAIINTQLLDLLIGAILSFAIFALILVVIQPLYFKAVLSFTEATKTSKRLNKSSMASQNQRKQRIKALMIFDIKTILRTPVFFTNYYLPGVLLPIMFLVPTLMGGSSQAFIPEDFIIQVQYFIDRIGAPTLILYTLVIASILGLFLGNLSTSAATMISRDGETIREFLMFPVPFNLVFRAKLLNSIITSSISPLIMLGVLFAFLPIPWYLIPFILIGLALGIVSIALLGAWIDITSPRINWVNEQDAVKGNTRQMFVMIPFMFIPMILLPIAFYAPFIVGPIIVLGLIAFLAFFGPYVDRYAREKLPQKIQNS